MPESDLDAQCKRASTAKKEHASHVSESARAAVIADDVIAVILLQAIYSAPQLKYSGSVICQCVTANGCRHFHYS